MPFDSASFKNQLLCAEVAKNAVGDADRAGAEASLWRSNLVAMAVQGRRYNDFAFQQGIGRTSRPGE
jgi:hypothetical protein